MKVEGKQFDETFVNLVFIFLVLLFFKTLFLFAEL